MLPASFNLGVRPRERPSPTSLPGPGTSQRPGVDAASVPATDHNGQGETHPASSGRGGEGEIILMRTYQSLRCSFKGQRGRIDRECVFYGADG